MKTSKIVTIICLIIMFLIGFATLVSDNKEPVISESENRTLQGMPHFTWDNIISGNFASDYEKYMIDKIPLRNVIIGINEAISQSLSIVTAEDALNAIDTESMQQMENMDIEVPEVVSMAPIVPTPTIQNTPEGTPDINATPTPEPTATPDPNRYADIKDLSVKMINEDDGKETIFKTYAASDVISYAQSLNQLSMLLPQEGNLLQIICLESSIARPAVSKVAQGYDITMIDETIEVLDYYTGDGTNVFSAAALFEEPMESGEQMYYFTDHHWTVEGAHYIYTEAMKRIGITPVIWDDYDVEYEFPFRGSYYRKAQTSYFIENPDTLAILSFPQADTFTHYLSKEAPTTSPIIYSDAAENDRYRVYFDGPQAIGPMSTIETTSNTGRNALVILDSFGLSFSTMLIPHYDTICIMDLRYMYKSTERYYISDMVSQFDVDDMYIVMGDINAYGTFYHTLINQFMYGENS